jgi:hypothetical protein
LRQFAEILAESTLSADEGKFFVRKGKNIWLHVFLRLNRLTCRHDYENQHPAQIVIGFNFFRARLPNGRRGLRDGL